MKTRSKRSGLVEEAQFSTAGTSAPYDPGKSRLGDTVRVYWNRTVVTLDTPDKVRCFNSHGNIYPILLRDECLVQIVKPERMSVTGRLWIPENAERPDFEIYQALVLATGLGRRSRKTGELDPIEIRVGEHVLVFFHHIVGASAVKYGDRDDLRIIAQWQVQACWPGNMTLLEAMR